MTYRNNLSLTLDTLADFSDFLKKENTSKNFKELQPWIPFCAGRCAFCYFPVNCNKQKISMYMEALKKVLSYYAKSCYVRSSEFNELYVGGGSPSILSQRYIKDILDYCRKNFNLNDDSKTKFTASTYDLTERKIHLLISSDVDQLDIGVQSFSRRFRKMLSLRDGAKDSKLKLKSVKKSGLGLSIDLLYNLPGQTVDEWKEEVNQALELDVDSVDCYPLDLYADTPLAKKIAEGKLPPAGDCFKELEMYTEASEIFEDNGYVPTCHNRFSRIKEDQGKISSEVVGTGAGFFMGHLGHFQYSDIEDVDDYIDAANRGILPLGRLTTLSREDEMRKAMMLIYVRMTVDREEFKQRFGMFPEEAFPKAMKELRSKGLVVEEKGKIRLSKKGDPWRFNIAWEFFR